MGQRDERSTGVKKVSATWC